MCSCQVSLMNKRAPSLPRVQSQCCVSGGGSGGLEHQLLSQTLGKIPSSGLEPQPEESGSSWNGWSGVSVEAPEEEEDGSSRWALKRRRAALQGHKRPLLSREVLSGWGRSQPIGRLPGLDLPGVCFHMVNVAI